MLRVPMFQASSWTASKGRSPLFSRRRRRTT
jgi:hypothetical protein